MKKFKSFEDLEEPGNQGSWADSYADLMSLLVCFLTVMLSASVMNAKKFETVSKAIQGKTDSKPSIQMLEEDLRKTLHKEKIQEMVDLVQKEEGLDLILRDTFLFPSGTAKLTENGKKKFRGILLSLHKISKDYKFSIEGHTDDRKVSNNLYPSNWHLSTARALSVLDLFLREKFGESRLSVQGFADQYPMIPNRNPKGEPIVANMIKNRRVVIKIR